MAKVKVTNVSPVDAVVDVNGEGKPEDMYILHPKNSATLEISEKSLKTIKSNKSLVVVTSK